MSGPANPELAKQVLKEVLALSAKGVAVSQMGPALYLIEAILDGAWANYGQASFERDMYAYVHKVFNMLPSRPYLEPYLSSTQYTALECAQLRAACIVEKELTQ